MNNIDKDIKIVEAFIKDRYLDANGIINGIKSGIRVDDRVNQAISNVLSELEELRKHDIRKIIELKNGMIEKAPSFTKREIELMNLGIALNETTEKSKIETYKKIVDERNKELNEENLRCSKLAVENNDLKEKLETYKKIAEKLAEEYKNENVHYDNTGIIYCELHYENDYTKHGKCSKHNNGANCKQCIIDWARKEVEK